MEQFNSAQLDFFRSLLGSERFSTGESNRQLHLHDISFHMGKLPAAVAWPKTTEEVARLLTFASETGLPAFPGVRPVGFCPRCDRGR